MTRVTTSWDDGDKLDNRLADLLEKYDVKGTFYITKEYTNRLSESQIKSLSNFHEIGAHTLTHPDLRSISKEQLYEEISGSKKWLEKILNKEVTMFCYPKGQCNEKTVAAVRESGFKGARTTEGGITTEPTDPFQMSTTIQVYPFPFRKINTKQYYWSKLFQPFIQRIGSLKRIGVPVTSMHSWLSMAKKSFDVTREKEGIFHLWGHSWEIERYGMWEDLEKLLSHISNKSDCQYLKNSEIIKNTNK